ncbi:MAG: hypothetical protein NZ740_01770 [Kiritimatiellae bacterium]|nr:hypothetical protein [Kiritimatiellia bacterium]MDW8457819.1 hypothetical protein [Verrucomicrobiota bacterium]
MKTHLYFMCYQTEALVASHLDPDAFGAYMAVGTRKHTSGNVIFFEVDPAEAVRTMPVVAEMEARCVPHPDGSPRRSKYLSIYRVLEHLPLASLGRLYLVTRDGRVMGLDGRPYDDPPEHRGPNFYTELAPVTPRVVSFLPPGKFVKFITDPKNPVHVPRIFFVDSLLDREPDGRLAGYLPYTNPDHIVDCINDVAVAEKGAKTVERNPKLIAFYRTIRRGFFVGDQSGVKFYEFPSPDELDEKYHVWWRSASLD